MTGECSDCGRLYIEQVAHVTIVFTGLGVKQDGPGLDPLARKPK